MPSRQRILCNSFRHFSSQLKRSINDTRFTSAMAHPPKKRRLKPINKDETDHEMMERLFGKRTMKKVDRVVEERSEIVEKSGRFEFMGKS